MTRSTRLISVVWLVVSLLGAALAGCSGSVDKSDPSQSDGGSRGKLDEQQPVGDAGTQPSQGDCAKSGCAKDNVCCESPFPCAGMCIPDCRVEGNACPSQAPTCNQATGLCAPDSGDGGPRPPMGDGGSQSPQGDCAKNGCAKDSVCCASPFPCAGMCIPDCRVEGNACPSQAATCNQATGLCAPDSGDGGPHPPAGDGGGQPPQGDCAKNGCPKDALCCASPLPCVGMCIPDCRVASNACPQNMPVCDQSSGFCGPTAVDGGK